MDGRFMCTNKKKECVYVCYGVERMDDIIAAAVYAS